MDTVDSRLALFSEMVLCSHDIHFWTYDANMQLLYSNCPDEMVYNAFFVLNKNHDYILEHKDEYDEPLILSNTIGLVWIAGFEKKDGILQRVHVLGPVFVDDISMSRLEAELQKANLSIALKHDFMAKLNTLPVIAITRILEYGLMMHYCITLQKIKTSDLNYRSGERTTKADAESVKDKHGTWAAERTILQLVRDGNLDYNAAMERLATVGMMGQMSKGDPIRLVKNGVIVFTALCSRASVEGGLSPEIAYILCDRYMQNTEACTTLGELSEVNRLMLEDYINRVHNCKAAASISRPIRECCDYIRLHVQERFSINEFAAKAGYSEYYLTKKFKKEVGCTISHFIKRVKIDHAKILLTSTAQTIQDISEQLGFCSQSYFAETFRKFAGVTPCEYREHPALAVQAG